MQIISFLFVLIVTYLIGSIPAGLIVVRFSTGKDIREVKSGRTGGTNAMRAAGFWAGLITTLIDIIKGASCVWFAQFAVPDNSWLEVLSPVMGILGHNYSIFLIERNERGRIRLRGGAGGAPTVGGAIGLWLPSGLIMIPLGGLILFGIGYASIATLSVPILIAIIFAIRAWNGVSPWLYVLYGILAELLLIWSLRPNISRLINGTERRISMRKKAGGSN